MQHQEILVAGLLTDQVYETNGFFFGAWIRVHKDGGMLIPLGGGDEDVRHVIAVQLTFLLFHLVPLAVTPVTREHFPEGLHGQEEHQLHMGNSSSQRLMVQSGDETFAGCHGHEKNLTLIL